MNDNNYLKDIISTSKTVAVKTYYYLEDILVFKEYEINEDDDLITQTKQFILRYRRLIGLILLAILLYILFYCDISNNKNKSENKEYSSGTRERVQKGGSIGGIPTPPPLPPSLAPPGPSLSAQIKHGAAQMKKRSTPQPTLEQKEKAKYETKKAKAALQEQFKADNAKQAQAEEKQKAQKEVADLKDVKDKRKADKASRSFGQKTKDTFYSKAGTELQRDKLKGAYKDSAIGKKVEEFKSMRSAGFSTKAAIGKNVYQAGAYVGEKFKEFAGWLYEILFAIAISIAICMVVLPSVSFFILALICFFLLKKKVASVKGL